MLGYLMHLPSPINTYISTSITVQHVAQAYIPMCWGLASNHAWVQLHCIMVGIS
jgi:hypothetical protein